MIQFKKMKYFAINDNNGQCLSSDSPAEWNRFDLEEGMCEKNHYFSIRWNSRYVPLFVFVSNHSSSCLATFHPVDNAILCFLGFTSRCIFLARKENDEPKKDVLIEKHKNRTMVVFMCIESMFGAGTIRVTAWILWIISKFCQRYIAMTLDIGLCQQSAVCRGDFLGSAESCWIPTLCKPCSWYFPQSFV